MRETKFRAFYEGVWYYQSLDEIITITLAGFRRGKHKTQFTGLKDCHGVELYEGDIISYYKYNASITAPVEFSEGAFRTHDGNTHTIAETKQKALGGFEIIGNFYENPELLATDSRPSESDSTNTSPEGVSKS